MLEELEIRNLGPIRQASLRPDFGMTAITGETGAGKSMLLSAVQLLSGQESQSSRVSPGADQAWVQGIFDLADNPHLQKAMDEAGAPCQDDELFLSRTIPVKGRSRSVANGKSVPRSVLSEAGGSLITIHGQTQQLKLSSAASQREFLDRCAQDDRQLEAYQQAYQSIRQIDERLENLVQEQSRVQAQADYLREAIARIEKVDPQRGEDQELKEQRSRIENAAEIAEAVSGALQALDGSPVDMDAESGRSAGDLIEQASARLQSSAARELFSDAIERLESAHEEIEDIIFSLSDQIPQDVSPRELDDINSRIHDLDDLTRRWGPGLDDVLAWKEKAQFDLEDLDASPEHLDQLREQRADLVSQAELLAADLSAERIRTAKALTERVNQELDSLAMAGSFLQIEVTSQKELGPWGADRISFLFTPFPGASALPVGKSASGGELSRLMLALELVAFDLQQNRQSSRVYQENQSDKTPGMTLIFDEVDAGVGGKSAVELGRRLSRLARNAQVIVVTHLAQVASWADSQYVVRKETKELSPHSESQSSADRQPEELVYTEVSRVTGEDRVEEIARMLSGTDTQASLDHARELLESSRL